MLHRIAFSRLHGMTVKLARQILSRLSYDTERFFSATPSQLAMLMGFDSKLFSDEMRSRALTEAARELQFADANGIRRLWWNGADTGGSHYPARLLECDDAPAMLYSLGADVLDMPHMVAVVGTRHATAYGIDFTTKLVNTLANHLATPPVIVSGLAYGIDVAAHRAALAAGVPTVAVLAHGLNTIYPAAHRNVAAEIVSNGGALITEYSSGDAVHRGNFLARNRIVAGISDCVIVVESDVKGGALVTARLAMDYNRDVFALPGRLSDKFSRGCNNLIAKNMAQLITEPEAIIDAMQWPCKSVEGLQKQLFETLNPMEQKVIDALIHAGEMRLSDLQMQLNEQTHRLMALLIDMELRGLVLAIPGNRYRLA